MTHPFRLTLEHLQTQPQRLTFRLVFDSSQLCLRLPYPRAASLRFQKPTGELIEWRNPWLESIPSSGSVASPYEFVLRPDDRIAFDLSAVINVKPDDPESLGWTIELPPGEARVEFVYEQTTIDWERYERYVGGSRMRSHAMPFAGRVVSNTANLLIT